MTAKIIDLPRRDDDTIPVVSGLPLIDADPAVIARFLDGKSWEDRAWFFDGILTDSLKQMIETGESLTFEHGTVDFYDWAMLRMHEQIGRTLDVWGEAKPGEDLAAVMYALSLNPRHRLATREYFKARGGGLQHQQFNQIAGDRMSLCIFHNGSGLVRPGLSHAWRYGIQGD